MSNKVWKVLRYLTGITVALTTGYGYYTSLSPNLLVTKILIGLFSVWFALISGISVIYFFEHECDEEDLKPSNVDKAKYSESTISKNTQHLF